MTADPNKLGIPDIQLTRENVVAFKEWLGSLAANALLQTGAVNFFIDIDGHVRMEIPARKVIRSTNKEGETG